MLALTRLISAADCNGNGTADTEDLDSAVSFDCNQNGVPDECEANFLELGQVEGPLQLQFLASSGLSGDLDGDDDLDLVVLENRGTHLSVFLNESERQGKEAGVFGAPDLYTASAIITGAVTGDFDGDGDLDLAASGRDAMFFYWNDGNGRFTEPVEVPLGEGRADRLAIGDLTGDGAPDLAVTLITANAVRLLVNRGDGTFELGSTVPLGGRPSAIVTGDLDGDGDVDFAVANGTSSDLQLFKNDGSGQFAAKVFDLDGRPKDLAIADLNQDGSPDLLVGFISPMDGVLVLGNSGDGESFQATTVAAEAGNVRLGDIDSDGDSDLFTWENGSHTVTVAFNDGTGRFPSTHPQGFGSPLTDVVCGDFDKDGDLDLAAVSRTVNVPLYWNREGESLWFFGTRVPMGGRLPHTIAIVDLDDDGDLDVATGNGGGATLTILTNDGAGKFTMTDEEWSGSIFSITAGDLDQDGDVDLAVRGPGVRIHLNQGNAVFKGQGTLNVASPFYLTTAQLNEDDALDIVVASEATRSLTVFLNLNDGNARFERPARNLRLPGGPRSVVPADLDGDGDVDLAAPGGFSRSVSVLYNRGDGSFGDHLELEASGTPVFTVAGDWNRDGLTDLATANAEGTGSVFFNQGVGTFGEAELFTIGHRPYSMDRADFNGDGFLDLVSTNENADNITVLLNRGGETFIAFADYPTGGGPRYSAVGDVDGDGDVDIVSADRVGRSLSVFLNQASPLAQVDFSERICTLQDFRSLAVRNPDSTLGVKFTLPARDDPTLLAAVFQNGRRFALHHEFLRTVFPERFAGLDARGLIGISQLRASREYFIGSIERLSTPEGPLFVYSLVTAAAAEEALTLQEVRFAHETLSQAFQLRPLAYAPDLTGQNPLARQNAQSWSEPGFDIFLGTVSLASDYIPYTVGVGFGRVRLFAGEAFAEANQSGRFTFQDIAVIDHAPRDVEGVVGGVITAAPQGVLSHVAIRTARRGTPNAFISGALAEFAPLEGQLVRLEVQADDYEIRPASLQEAESFWAQRPSLPEPRTFDPEYARLDRFEEMDLALDAAVAAESRFGGKATGLARLETILNGPYQEYRERGFAIPMRYYLEFMEMNQIPSPLDPTRQVSYRQYLEELFGLAVFHSDSQRRFEALANFREFARQFGEIPAGLTDALAERIEEVFGSTTTMVRFRSSSNVEDVLQFNGAGLYESTSVCIADTLDGGANGPSHCDPTQENERTVERALKKVWTSLWTFRAHEERAFFQIPQQSAAMGILVNRAFLDEAANGVAFTGDPTDPRGGCYLVTVQVGEESVVSPDPGILPEVDTLEVADGEVVNIVRARSSSLLEPGRVVLSDAQLRELGALMWHIDEHFPLDTEGHPRQDILLDLEFKLEPDGSLAVKQVRPFLTAGAKSSRPTFELEIPPDTVVCGRQNLLSPSGDPHQEYELKSVVRFRSGTVELPASHCFFSAELFEEVVVGPQQEMAVAEGPGFFRVEEHPNAAGTETLYTFSYRQIFSLSDERRLELDLVNLEFSAIGGDPTRKRLVVDESFLTFGLRLFGFLENRTITYASCTYDLLPAWELEAELADGTQLRLGERFLVAEDFTLTGPASVERVELSIGGTHQVVTDYWQLVYSSGRHNTAVKYWVLLNTPVSLAGLERRVHAIEFAAPDPPEFADLVAELATEAAAYLDENFEVIARPEVVAVDKKPAASAPQPRFLRGDADVDGRVGTADAVRTLGTLFLLGAPLECDKAADANDDGRININDPLHTLGHLFRGRTMPPPTGLCDVDPTADHLDCDAFGHCF